MLQIVSGSEVNTPSSGTRIDGESFRRAALAPGKLAEAIGDNVGGLFQEVSQNIQANRNARMVFDADLTMRKTKDGFTADLAKMPDEGTWLPAYKQRVDTVRQQVLDNPHAGPEVRRMLSQKFDHWEAVTTAEVRTAALLKGAQQTREAAIADSTYAAHQGDIKGAMDTLNAAVAHYAMTPADVKKISSRFPSISAQAQADTAIATNPIKAPDLIKQFEGTIEPAVYVGVRAKAEAARHGAQSENLNDLSAQMENSPDGTIDPKLLSEKVKAGEITQRGADGLIARMKRENVAEDKEEAALVSLDLTEHDFVADKKPQESKKDFTERINAIANPGLRTRLQQKLQNRMDAAKKEGVNEEKPVHREIFDQLKKDREDNALLVPLTEEDSPEKGMLWWKTPSEFKMEHIEGGLKSLNDPKHPGYLSDDDIKEKFGDKMTREKLVAAERSQAALVNQKMEAFFKGKPDATYQEADDYRKELERPYVMTATKQALAKHIPVMVLDEADFKALPAGTNFIFNGRVGTKH